MIVCLSKNIRIKSVENLLHIFMVLLLGPNGFQLNKTLNNVKVSEARNNKLTFKE